MQLPFVMGTELTGIHLGYKEGQERRPNYDWGWVDNRRNHDLNAVKRALHASHTQYHGAHHDDHCIEISSKKLETYTAFKQFSIKTRKALADQFYFPKNPTAVCGGAHVHVGLHGHKRLKYELCRDLIMRPYLPWIFGEPDENGAMNVLINTADQFQEYTQRLARGEYINHYHNARYIDALMKPFNHRTNYAQLSDWQGKNHMFRLAPGYGTMEFRFMEMAPTWEEQELQLNFICQYMKWMQKRVENEQTTEVKLITDPAMQAIKPSTCVDLFAELCYDINIDFEEYKPFVRRNLYPRWQNGRTRV